MEEDTVDDDAIEQGHRPVPGAVPGPTAVPRPGGWLPGRPAGAATAPAAGAAPVPDPGGRFAGLPGRPVAEHVGVFEAELERLQRELSTIDQL